MYISKTICKMSVYRANGPLFNIISTMCHKFVAEAYQVRSKLENPIFDNLYYVNYKNSISMLVKSSL